MPLHRHTTTPMSADQSFNRPDFPILAGSFIVSSRREDYAVRLGSHNRDNRQSPLGHRLVWNWERRSSVLAADLGLLMIGVANRSRGGFAMDGASGRTADTGII